MIVLREITLEDAAKTLAWRTSERVTKNMLTDIPHDIEAQKAWILASRTRPDYYHWIIQDTQNSLQTDIGWISLQDYSPKTQETSFGFYIGEKGYPGAGLALLPGWYTFLFNTLGIQTVFLFVFASNARVVQMHTRFGCVPVPEKNFIHCKNGTDIPVVCLAITNKIWAEKKEFHTSPIDCPINLWQAAPATVVDKVGNLRQRE